DAPPAARLRRSPFAPVLFSRVTSPPSLPSKVPSVAVIRSVPRTFTMETSLLTYPPAPAARAGRQPPSVRALVAVLRQLAELLAGLNDEQYRPKPAGIGSSVGGHVRHCLDHVAALLAGVERGALDYDRRERGTEVETRRSAALAALEHLER